MKRMVLVLTVAVIVVVILVGVFVPEVPRWLLALIALIGPPFFLSALRNASDAVSGSRALDDESNRADDDDDGA